MKKLIGLLFLIWSPVLWGQQFTMTVSQTEMGLYDQVELVVSSSGDYKSVEMPDNLSQNFRIVGQFTSSSYSMGFGGNGSTIEKTFTLQPKRKGTFTINPATAKLDGKLVKTKPITIKVVAQDQKKAPAGSPEAYAKELVMVRARTTNRKPYVGEVFVGNYDLLWKTQIGQVQQVDQPDFTGFYQEELEDKNRKEQREVVDGQRWTKLDLGKFLLVPQKSGKYRPGKLALNVQVGVPTNRVDMFGQRRMKAINVIAEDKFPSIEVQPLPAAGKPEGFNGAVGDFSFNATLSRDSVEANSSVSLTLTLKGKGNLRMISLPEYSLPNSLEVFDPKKSESIQVGTYGMKGRQTVEYIIVPRYKGDYKIPSLSFSYFDPQKEVYQILKTPEMVLHVKNGAPLPESFASGESPINKKPTEYLVEDIAHIDLETPEWEEGKTWRLKGKWIWISLLFWPFAFAIFLLVNRKGKDLASRFGKSKNQKQIDEILRKWKSAEKLNETGNTEESLRNWLEGLWLFVELVVKKKRGEIKGGNWTSQEMSEENVGLLKAMINRAEMARYAPFTNAQFQEDLSVGRNLIKEWKS